MPSPKTVDERILTEDNQAVYTLGVTSKLADIPAHSIRQYIDMDLIIPFKLESKRHLFSQKDIDRLKKIRELIHENGLNFAGVLTLMAMVPCWAVRGCSKSDAKSCGAYTENFKPCWIITHKGDHCKNQDCRNCEVYHSLMHDGGVKSMLNTLL